MASINTSFTIPADKYPSDPRFGVGPSKVPTQHLESLLQSGADYMGNSHRKKNVVRVIEEVHAGLKSYFELPSDYQVVMGNGGASIMWDMIGLGIVKKKSLHYAWGEFSQKAAKAHARIPWIETTSLTAEMGEAITPTCPQDDVDLVCYALNETSTGVQMTSVIKEAKERDVLVCVDATSGAGQIPMDLPYVDVFYFSPQKVLAADGGLFIAFLSPKAVARIAQIKSQKDRYIPAFMDFGPILEYGAKAQTATTPGLANLWLINEQLKELNQHGQQKVYELAQQKAKLLYDWADSKDYLSCFVKRPELRSQSVATIDLDEAYPVDEIAKWLRTNKVAVDIEGYRQLNRNQFRISLFHSVALEDLEKLTWIISKLVEG